MLHRFVPRVVFAITAASCVLRACVALGQETAEFFTGLEAPAPNPSQSLPTEEEDWYKDAVVYHIWVAAFRDSDESGVGDIRGVIEGLDTLQQLGVNTLWLSPFFESASSIRN